MEIYCASNSSLGNGDNCSIRVIGLCKDQMSQTRLGLVCNQACPSTQLVLSVLPQIHPLSFLVSLTPIAFELSLICSPDSAARQIFLKHQCEHISSGLSLQPPFSDTITADASKPYWISLDSFSCFLSTLQFCRSKPR